MPVPLIPVVATKTIAAAGDYAAGDVVSNSASAGTAWSWPKMAPSDGFTGFIYHALIKCSAASVAAVFRLHLFDREPTSASTVVNDNVARSIHVDDMPYHIGTIDFEAMKNFGGFSEARSLGVYYPYRCKDGAHTLYGILETTTAEANESAGMTLTITLTPAANPF